MGYTVRQTPYVADNGVDGYLEKEGKLSVLQCKRVKGAVGEPVLRDLFGTMHAAGAHEGIVVTTGNVSSPAKAWAHKKPIRIIELHELITHIRIYYGEDTKLGGNPEVRQASPTVTAVTVNPMVVMSEPKKASPDLSQHDQSDEESSRFYEAAFWRDVCNAVSDFRDFNGDQKKGIAADRAWADFLNAGNNKSQATLFIGTRNAEGLIALINEFKASRQKIKNGAAWWDS